MQLRISIDERAVRAKIDKALASPKIRKLIYDRVYSRFYAQKQKFLNAFDNHIVTAELNAGPRGVNITNSLDGYGNLFSFIGFPSNEKPAQELRNFFQTNIEFNASSYRNRHYYFKISIPTQREVERITPLPWDEAQGSWVEAIEDGLDNAPQFLFKKWTQGRSKTGLQLPNDIENNDDLRQSPIKYTSALLSDFRIAINNIRI